jgi:hypothetical protein
MNILAAIQNEELRLEKELNAIRDRLNRVRAAGEALGELTGRRISVVKKRVLSKAAREKIAKAARKRWAKVRADAKKALG